MKHNNFDLKKSIDNFGYSKNKNDEDDEPVLKISNRNLYRANNHIYFYDAIDTQTQLWLQSQMMAAYEEYIISNAKEVAMTSAIAENIYIHINSPGGDLTSSLAIYDFIKNFPMTCVGVVEGMAASGASIILCACTLRQMTRTSVVLCHELRHWGFYYSTWHNVQDQYINDKFFMDKIKEIYLTETTIPPATIDEALSHDLYWGVDKCLEYQLCDVVSGTDLSEEDLNKIDKRVAKRIQNNINFKDFEAVVEDKKTNEKQPRNKQTTKRRKTSKKIENPEEKNLKNKRKQPLKNSSKN